jgi:hypothetical protein
MRANLRHIWCDAITRTQQGLSANITVAALPQASANGNDEGQQRTDAMRRVLVVPAFNPVTSQPLSSWTFVLSDVVRSLPKYSLSAIFVVLEC